MQKKTIILIHALYWFYIINQTLFPVYVGKLEGSSLADGQFFKDIIISLILNAISFYAIYFIFPKLAAFRNKLLLVLSAMALVSLVVAVRVPVNWSFWMIFGNLPGKEPVFQWTIVWIELRMVIITGIYSVLIYFFIRAIETQKLRDELIHQRQAGELALLKSQVNPHFLFNTLNNIYSLVYHKSDDAPMAVMKFSSIMRYVLHDSAAEKVRLEKEIEYLTNYIELQKLRIRDPEFVSFRTEGDPANTVLAPMLLIPFVENAFKHADRDRNPGISILLRCDNQKIYFEVSNFRQKEVQTMEKPYRGVGLDNIRKRLQLIYPGKHDLSISEEDGQYIVKLLIQP